jgi:hypothetical protein
VRDVKNTWMGDADLNGEFSSAYMITVLPAGQYEDTIHGNSAWSEGDWNGDGDFTSADLITALAEGGYEVGPRAAPVPEPGALLLLMARLPKIGCLRGARAPVSHCRDTDGRFRAQSVWIAGPVRAP